MTLLNALPPGPELATVLARLDPAALGSYDLVDFIKASERQASWTSMIHLRAVAELSGRKPLPFGDGSGSPADRLPVGEVNEFTDLELAAALRLSRPAAAHKLELALRLRALPALDDALSRGFIDLTRARVIAEGVGRLDEETAAAVVERLLVRAPNQTAAHLRRSTERAVQIADPVAVEQAHQQAVEERRVVLTPTLDGMAEIWALLPADKATALFMAVTALADQAKAPDDLRTIDQRRADVLGDLATTVLEKHELPRRHGRRPQLQVTVAATTLLGLDNHPGELAGYGPIPASMSRDIAADATWRRILTDPESGALLDYGTTTYAPPQSLADHVINRDRTCRWPGCRQRALRCDLDHRNPYPCGPTAEHNLHALCRRHHRAKTEGGWTYTRDCRGNLTWTSPTGHSSTHPPEPQLGELSPPAWSPRGSSPPGSIVSCAPATTPPPTTNTSDVLPF